MSLTDEEFRQQHQPLQVPAAYNEAVNDIDKVVFALADIGEGSAAAVAQHMQVLDPTANPKMLIATVHEVLTSLYERGQIAGNDRDGDLVYNLHKITQANTGTVDPDLLAPGLD